MVLYPLKREKYSATERTSAIRDPIPAWEAVERKQKQASDEWWLIAQPDHAALAGDIAANLRFPCLPNLDSEVIRAIALHDSGWARFDGGERGTGRDLEVSLCDPKLDDQGRPLSFLDMTPAEFLQAWTDSIERAQQTGSLGGAIVSQPFVRLAQNRRRSHPDDEGDKRELQDFVLREEQRQRRLLSHERTSAENVATLTDVLQFCDLLSLYLCCGAEESVEFPQSFNSTAVRLTREGEMCRLEPPLLSDGVSLGVTARRYPLFGAIEITTLPFLLS